MTHKTEVSLTIPNLEDLYCLNCKVNPVDMHGESIVKSLFHCQILTCRLIIYSVRCCIASPSIQNIGDSVHVIISKKFFCTGKLQEHLRELKVQFTDPEEVHPKIYEACLKYTFTFKLAPLWNLVGKSFYVRGFNFLPPPPTVEALEWNILFKDGDTKLELKPMKINFSPLTLDFLLLTPSILDNFINNPNCTINTINLTIFQCPWVYVLPKLTRARLISVSKTLPDTSPFNNYNDLRRHWKNMYSYRLPKTSDGMMFYEVVFPTYPNEPFVYPDICLLSKNPEFLMCDNKNEIALQFTKDLSKSVQSVCGEVIKIGHLYSKLNIEYSCVLKNKNDDNSLQKEKTIDQFRSSFFQSPDCIIIPPDEKPKLSSLFTFRGVDQMSTPMRNHTQQVLAIMDNQKPKKASARRNNSQNLTSKMTNSGVRKTATQYGSQRTIDNFLSGNQQKTIISDIDDICSYYDIPSMYPDEPDNSGSASKNGATMEKECENQSNLNFKSIPTEVPKNAPDLNQPSNPKPIIKKVERVNFDLNGIKKIRTTHEISRPNAKFQKLKYNQLNNTNVTNNSTDKTNYCKPSTSNLIDKDEKKFLQNYKYDPRYQGFHMYDLNNKRNLSNDVHSELPTPNLDALFSTKMSSQKHESDDEHKQENSKIESCNDVRALLSSFDLYNIHQKEEEDIESIIYKQCNNFRFSFDSAKKSNEQKLSQEHESQKCSKNCHESNADSQIKTSSQEPKVQQFIENDFEHNLYVDEHLHSQSKSSPSLLCTSIRKNNENVSEHDFIQADERFQAKNYSQEGIQTNLCESPFIKPSQFEKARAQPFKKYELPKCNSNEGNAFNDLQFTPPVLDASTRLRERHKSRDMNSLHNSEINFHNKSELSSFKINLKDELKEKIPQKYKYVEVEQNLDNFSIYKKAQENLFNMSESQPSSVDMFEGSINRTLLQVRKSPTSVFNSNNRSENMQESNNYQSMKSNFNKDKENSYNASQYSPSIFNTYENQYQKLSPESDKFNQSLQGRYFEDTHVPKKISQCTFAESRHNSQNSKFTEKYEIEFDKLDEYCTPPKPNDTSDFTSILSQSSNGSNSENYESYKQACTEALTFN